MLKPIALFALVACLGGCAVAPGTVTAMDTTVTATLTQRIIRGRTTRVIRLSMAVASTSAAAGAGTVATTTTMDGTTGTAVAFTVAGHGGGWGHGGGYGHGGGGGQWQGGGGGHSGGGHGGGRG